MTSLNTCMINRSIKKVVHVERTCSNCMWLTRIMDDHYACSNGKVFCLHMEQNADGKWVKIIKGHRYFVGRCKRFVENNERNQRRLWNSFMNGMQL